MNKELYQDLVNWLDSHEIRKEASDWTKNILLTSARRFETDGDILYRKKGTLSLPVIREGHTKEFLGAAHDLSISGHMGQRNTYYRLQDAVWWPGIQEDVVRYVKSCDTCQKRKKNKEIPEPSSATIQPEPFYHIGIDVMGPLPVTTTNKRYIILAIDFFTKYVEGVAVEEADAQTVTKFIHSDIICRHGVPKEITSDRGTEFCNKLVEELSRTYHIKHIKTTAYHPQGNGQTERANQTVKNILSKITKEYGAWDFYLDSALHAIRTIKQASTEYSPFELVYGRKPNREFHHTKKDNGSYDDRLWSYIMRDITRLQLIRRKAAGFIEKAQERQRDSQIKKANASKIHIGDEILIFRNIVESSWSAKMEPKWEGPYLIHDIKGQSIFLRNSNGSVMTSPVHRSKIKLYHRR
jgi:Integrase zinc binding domain/Integrase core domain